jgi:hypothetical protein
LTPMSVSTVGAISSNWAGAFVTTPDRIPGPKGSAACAATASYCRRDRPSSWSLIGKRCSFVSKYHYRRLAAVEQCPSRYWFAPHQPRSRRRPCSHIVGCRLCRQVIAALIPTS